MSLNSELHTAVHQQKLETIKALVQQGADVNAKDMTVCIPL